MVKNRRISFHMHSHSSAELKHNYSWVLLVGRGRRYLMTCWKTVTPGWKLHSKLSRHFQSNAAKKGAEEEEEEELFPCLVWWYLNQLFAQRVDGSDFSGYLRSFVAQPRAVFSALQWKCYCSRTLKHVRPSGAQQGLWSQTLFSSPMLRLPSLTFTRNFRGILLPIPNKKPAGKLWQLLVSANRTECYQHTAAHPPNISIFAKMDRYIFTSCKKNKKQEFSVDLTTSCWSPDVFAENLLVITVATEETDGFLRFMRTAQEFNYTVKVTHTHKLHAG